MVLEPVNLEAAGNGWVVGMSGMVVVSRFQAGRRMSTRVGRGQARALAQLPVTKPDAALGSRDPAVPTLPHTVLTGSVAGSSTASAGSWPASRRHPGPLGSGARPPRPDRGGGEWFMCIRRQIQQAGEWASAALHHSCKHPTPPQARSAPPCRRPNPPHRSNDFSISLPQKPQQGGSPGAPAA